MHDIQHLLEVPRLRVQNANAISGPHTWGFPAMSAFVGLMHALERKLAAEGLEVQFNSVGVICHRHQPQVDQQGYIRKFHLTRNPVNKKGETAAIVEEGRTHLEITLVFAVSGVAVEAQARSGGGGLETVVSELLPTLRIAGGTIQPAPGQRGAVPRPRLITLAEDEEEYNRQVRRLLHGWLPGFALVGRDDLLEQHHAQLLEVEPTADRLDAWLDLARFNWAAHRETPTDSSEDTIVWKRRGPPRGWLVPIPVGYGALSPLHEAGTVVGARDEMTPFRFVESLYSIGEWKSPHRLTSPFELLWYVDNEEAGGLYRLRNDYYLTIN